MLLEDLIKLDKRTDNKVPGPVYSQCLKALQEAHDACCKAEERSVLGMSSGPFSGVNEALGYVKELEDCLWLNCK